MTVYNKENSAAIVQKASHSKQGVQITTLSQFTPSSTVITNNHTMSDNSIAPFDITMTSAASP